MSKINVAVINSSKEITEMLTEILEDEGFKTCSTFTYVFKGQITKFDEYVKVNKPDVIVYDIAPPYRENYFFFQKLFKRKIVKEIPCVLTTTNKTALEGFVGKTDTHELIGKPYDLQEIIDAIHAAYNKQFLRAKVV